ncbi:MAG: GNAT family N-acetyltransferase [Actinomycetota bacterium]|nr:GNAT family N-acetyltransferase [Actinomycetota bacterium]
MSWPGLAERLEGRLVVLEPTRLEHEEPLWEAAQDPAVWTLMSIEAGARRELFDRWWEHLLGEAEKGAEVPLTTIERSSGRVIGSTRYLALRPEHRGLEIGHTWLRSDAWGTGANVEAKLLMLAHAFERMGCMRVELKTDARNERSRKAMEALPARFEGIFRKHMLVRGEELRDSAWYAITDDEWPNVRANLGRRLASRG